MRWLALIAVFALAVHSPAAPPAPHPPPEAQPSKSPPAHDQPTAAELVQAVREQEIAFTDLPSFWITLEGRQDTNEAYLTQIRRDRIAAGRPVHFDDPAFRKTQRSTIEMAWDGPLHARYDENAQGEISAKVYDGSRRLTRRTEKSVPI